MIRKINDAIFTDIADAIREKNGETTTYRPAEMPEAILAIETGGGGGGGEPTEDRVKTPEELYAECRPESWPVLPEPTEENEIYYLCRTKNARRFVVPRIKENAPFTTEAGYIDENGAFVAVDSMSGQVGGVWDEVESLNWDSRMDTYHVIRTTGADSTYEYCISSTDASNSTMAQVLEVKARGANLGFNAKRSSNGGNSNGFANCAFITFYGPQNWTGIQSYKFYQYKNLVCILFDSEENNPFLQSNNTITSATYMFGYCQNLRHMYPITKWSKVTMIDGMFQACYALEYLTLDFSLVTSLSVSSIVNYCRSLKNVSIKLPKCTSASPGSSLYIQNFSDLDLSGCTSTSQQYYWAQYAYEVNNLKLSPLNMSSKNTGVGTYNNANAILRRIVMSPEQTGDKMPTSWGIYMRYATYKSIKDFVDSLPTTTAGNVITIYNNWLAMDMPPDILQTATDKGYTLAAATV